MTSRSRRHGVARILSKRGLCSRSEAERRVRNGRVSVNGRTVLDPEFPVDAACDLVEMDGAPADASVRSYIALNKPRGLVTSTADERGRDTVYTCLADAGIPWLAPVGRLDRASEGLLLFSNDPEWAAGITDPVHALHKTYHVQIGCLPGASLLAAMREGVEEGGERLQAVDATLLRSGAKNAWLEVVLDEGRNRHIRRLLAVLDAPVLRLLRVSIGDVVLGDLAKGAWRHLSAAEVASLSNGDAPKPAGRARR